MYTWKIAAIITAIKVLLIPSYRSTDFEVHRNWLAITHSLPISKWYYEDTSEWTLDYPPFFALFERFLSFFAKHFDPEMLKVENLKYASEATVIFQRLSVIVSDFLFIYAAAEYCTACVKKRVLQQSWLSSHLLLFVLLVANVGLLMVDHIHFQYNGFLFGWLLLSCTRICQNGYLEGAFWFATLLNYKHIYLYIAPAYGIYLLRMYCFKSRQDGSIKWQSFSVTRLLQLGLIVISVFSLSFGPFIVMNQLPQVMSRLFPFKRGLCHAYWAPNFWVFYNVVDKVALTIGTKLYLLSANTTQAASMTGGLVQEYDHTVLPSIKPLTTFIFTAAAMLPAIYKLWVNPRGPRGFLQTIVLCAFASYMFGWHVHEKAILLVTIPLSLLAVERKKDAHVFLILSTVGHFSLFPLIFTQAETLAKYLMMLTYTVFSFYSLGILYQSPGSKKNLPLLNKAESLYLLGLVPLELYCNLFHYFLGLDNRLPFLPLLLTSLYCSVGVFYSWIVFYLSTLREGSLKSTNKRD